MSDERRLAGRSDAANLPNETTARIRPGHQVRLIDVSARGVLIESHRRLLPGIMVELLVESARGPSRTRARVVRVYVSEVLRDALVYRAGLALDATIDWPLDQGTR